MIDLELAGVRTTDCLIKNGMTTCRCPYAGCNFDCIAHDCVEIDMNGQKAEKCNARCKNKEGIEGPYTTHNLIKTTTTFNQKTEDNQVPMEPEGNASTSIGKVHINFVQIVFTYLIIKNLFY